MNVLYQLAYFFFFKLWIAQMVTKEVIVKTDVRFQALDTVVNKCAYVPENNAILFEVANWNKTASYNTVNTWRLKDVGFWLIFRRDVI